MYEKFGAVAQGLRVEFNLFLPDNTRDPSQYVRGGSPRIKQIHVRGDFQGVVGSQNWQLDDKSRCKDWSIQTAGCTSWPLIVT